MIVEPGSVVMSGGVRLRPDVLTTVCLAKVTSGPYVFSIDLLCLRGATSGNLSLQTSGIDEEGLGLGKANLLTKNQWATQARHGRAPGSYEDYFLARLCRWQKCQPRISAEAHFFNGRCQYVHFTVCLGRVNAQARTCELDAERLHLFFDGIPATLKA